MEPCVEWEEDGVVQPANVIAVATENRSIEVQRFIIVSFLQATGGRVVRRDARSKLTQERVPASVF
jgi:hypothetical protein